MERVGQLEHPQHERFGPFVIVRAIGRGGMGEVYVARTPWTDSPLAAVKRLRPDVARIPTFADRFKHESELSVRLDHPNVVGTLDVGSVGDQLYVASDLVLGKDTGLIADRLRERGQGAPLAVVVRLLSDTLSGLAYVHGAREPDGTWLKLVHRDITPGNVLVSYDGVAQLADFGLAKSSLTESSELTQHGEILGTPHYLAPEVVRSEPAGPASDIYGLGAVTYRILTGMAPHQGTTAEVLVKALSEKPRSLAEMRPDLPPWVVQFVHGMLEMDPKKRPQDAAMLKRQLNHEAKRSNLLLPQASVGRWLGALFEAERFEELEEAERIRRLDPDELPAAVEGTVVLAAARGASILAPPPPIADDVEGNATDLELDLDKRRRPRRNDTETGDGDFARSASRDSDILPSVFDEEDDGMPTRSFNAPDPRLLQDDLQPVEPADFHEGTHPDSMADALQQEALEVDTGSLDPSETYGDSDEVPVMAISLPGFVDTGDGPAQALRRNDPAGVTSPVDLAPSSSDEQQTFVANIEMSSLDATDMASRPRRTPATALVADETPALEQGPPKRARRSSPDSVIVQPVPLRGGGSKSIAVRSGSAQVGPARGASAGPAPARGQASGSLPSPPVAPHPPAVNRPPVRQKISVTDAPQPMPSAARQAPSVVSTTSVRTALLPLLVWVAVAIVIGVGIGMYVSAPNRDSTTTIEPIAQSLSARYRTARRQLAAKRAAGDLAAPDADQVAADAADALVLGDVDRAEVLISELEQILAAP